MEELKVHMQHVILCKYKNHKNTKETAKKISSVFDQNVITDYLVRNLFAKFRSVDMSLSDWPRQECSSDLFQDTSRELVECNLRRSSRESKHILTHLNLPSLEK